jgi:hypothetical protein
MANVAGSESPMNASFPATDALCSNSAGCLFATEAGVFKAWHLILIIATIVTIAAVIICKIIPCKRWPPVNIPSKHENPTNDLVLEEVVTANQLTEQQIVNDSRMVDGLSPAVDYTMPVVSGMDQQYSGYVLPEGIQERDYIAERSVDEPLNFTVGEEPPDPTAQQEVVVTESLILPSSQNTEQVAVNEGSFLEYPQPRKSSFRKDSKKRHSYHFEKPHVSFRLEAEGGQSRQFEDMPDPILDFAGQLFLSGDQHDVVPPLPAPVPPYQRYGSYQGFPYISPGSGGHKVSSSSGPPAISNAELRSSTQV